MTSRVFISVLSFFLGAFIFVLSPSNAQNQWKYEENKHYRTLPLAENVRIENDKVEVKRVYMGLVFMYEDARELNPVIQTTTGLEYDITTNIKK